MSYEIGCEGRVLLGKLSRETEQRLRGLRGEWLEFEPSSCAIVVRHCQPSAAPCLPTVASELVQMLAELTDGERALVPGGDLTVYPEGGGSPARLRAEAGGALAICWAHPDYTHARRVRYLGGEALVEPQVQRLNGSVELAAKSPSRAARELEALADCYEGLYPEGSFAASADERGGRVRVSLRDVNLDVVPLIECLRKLAAPDSLSGRIEVSSFAVSEPRHFARFTFERGAVWLERPALFEPSRLRERPPIESGATS